MIKVIYGEKGMGKTKILVDTANKVSSEKTGDVVFIDNSSQLIYDLKHEIRFINLVDFPELDSNGFLGFVCGVVSQNYDIEAIFVDGLNYIVGRKAADLENILSGMKNISERHNLKFYITINGKENEIPEFMKKYM